MLMALLAAVLAACGGAAPAAVPSPPGPTPDPAATVTSVRLEPALGGYEFRSPTNLAELPGGAVLVSEQAGRILVFDGVEAGVPGDFLDLRDRVSDRGWEEGLLGLALAPDFAVTGHFYVYYSASEPRRSVVSRFTADAGRTAANANSELVILEVGQPYANHNGGQLAFGPDGYLYVGLGDGGSGGDPQGHGQDVSTLLGAILRIDVAGATAERPYGIPADNPFAGAAGLGRGEIWAYGLRNPWRFSFDRETGRLWAGDVGQDRYEEVDVIVRGGNYGWNRLEGNHCFAPRDGCGREGMVAPVWEYALEDGACSVIGGYVYRGTALPGLAGVYLFADFCSGRVYGLPAEGDAGSGARLLADSGLRVASFGEDGAGEVYVLSQGGGVWRVVGGGG